MQQSIAARAVAAMALESAGNGPKMSMVRERLACRMPDADDGPRAAVSLQSCHS